MQSDHIEFVNSGNGVADLNGSIVNLIFAQSTESLDWVDFGAFSPANFILPGQTITVPIQEQWLNDQTLTAVDIKLQQ
ncbi:hypothetical protein JCM19233_1820 [Vibrio astriarenae]|nr:hypothetical protein JCM19233_1820 [Vibrio sp. C7]